MDTTLQHPRRPLGRWVAILLAAAATAAMLAVSPAQVHAANTTPHEVASLPVLPPQGTNPTTLDVTFVVDSFRNRAVEFVTGSGSTRVSTFDLGEPAAPALLGSVTTTGSLVAEGSHHLDPSTGLIYAPVPGTTGLAAIAVVDPARVATGATDAVRRVAAPQSYAALAFQGFRFETANGKLLMLFANQVQTLVEGVSAGATGPGKQTAYQTVLAQWDPTSLTEDWQRVVTGCGSGELSHLSKGSRVARLLIAPPFLSSNRQSINILCAVGEEGVQFVKVAVDATGAPAANPASTIFAGTSLIRKVIVDATAERTHLIVGIYGSYALTFDWRVERVSGTTAVSQVTGAQHVATGADPASGRYYIMLPPVNGSPPEPGGLLMVDGRRSPTPQALAFPDALVPSGQDSPRIEVFAPAGSDKRYLLVRPMKTTIEGTDRVALLEDPVPVSVDPPATSVDRTTDVDEREGVTDSAYAAEAGAYGTRLLVSGGALPAGSPVFKQLGACNNANREITFGAIPVSSLSNIAAAARSFAADADQGTRADSRDRARCWPDASPPAPLQGSGSEWLDGRSECVGDVATSAKDVPQSGASTKATCEYAKNKVAADSVYPGLDSGLVTVARSHASTSVMRLDSGGVESSSEAVSEGVKIAGVGEIGIVRSLAIARSNGRKKTDKPRSEWTVTMCGVKTATGDYSQSGCRSGKDTAPAIDALNRAAGGRFVFVQHRPDESLQNGSPGGYISGVQRNQAEVNLARLENNDGSYAVAALEIQRRNDNSTGVNRQIVQLAGVRAVSAYGISVLPTTPGFDENTPPAPGTPLSDSNVGLGSSVVPHDPGTGIAPTPAPSDPGGLGGFLVPKAMRDTIKLIRNGFEFLARNPTQALLALGIWLSLLLPWAMMRRRSLLASIV
jgi:hypothetical protein